MAKALVTGGAGFIGSHLVEALLSQGWEVAVLDNLTTGSEANLAAVRDRIGFHRGDIRDLDALRQLSRGCDTVFHQAAVVSVPKTMEDPVATAAVNELGTLNVLEAARRGGVRRVVLASSCAVYGDAPHLPVSEGQEAAPRSPYALQKLAGELHARLYHQCFGLQTVALRYFNVYGPRQDPSSPYSGVISIFMQCTRQGLPATLHGDGRQSRDFVFVRDVVAANLCAAAADAIRDGSVFNVGTGRQIEIGQLWQAIAALAGQPAETRQGPERPGDVRASQADTHRADELLGFRAHWSLKQGLADTLKWFQGAAGRTDKAAGQHAAADRSGTTTP
jgi:UDP-glucose 4-epimerase